MKFSIYNYSISMYFRVEIQKNGKNASKGSTSMKVSKILFTQKLSIINHLISKLHFTELNRLTTMPPYNLFSVTDFNLTIFRRSLLSRIS